MHELVVAHVHAHMATRWARAEKQQITRLQVGEINTIAHGHLLAGTAGQLKLKFVLKQGLNETGAIHTILASATKPVFCAGPA